MKPVGKKMVFKKPIVKPVAKMAKATMMKKPTVASVHGKAAAVRSGPQQHADRLPISRGNLQAVLQAEELTVVGQAARGLPEFDQPDLRIFLNAVQGLAAEKAAILSQARELNQDRILQFPGLFARHVEHAHRAAQFILEALRPRCRRPRPRSSPVSGSMAFSSEACPALDAGWIPVRTKKTREIRT